MVDGKEGERKWKRTHQAGLDYRNVSDIEENLPWCCEVHYY